MTDFPNGDAKGHGHYGDGTGYTKEVEMRDADGDALRLAVDLQLTIQVGKLDGTVVVTSNNDSRIYESENWNGDLDPLTATRLAILRAAKSIKGE